MFLFFLLLSILVQRATCDVYSSYENIKNLNKIEDHLLQMLSDYIAGERERLNTLEKYQQYVINSKSYTNPELYISYPTNQFNVIHRFVANWNDLSNWTKSQNEAISSAIRAHKQLLPGQNDVDGAVKAIHRLQDIYKIRASHFSRGDSLVPDQNNLIGQPLNEKALLVFIKDAYNSENWLKCAGWGQQAFYRLQTYKEHDPTTDLWFDVADHFAFCLYKAEQLLHAIEVTKEILVHHPDHKRIAGNMRHFNKLMQKRNMTDNSLISKRSVIAQPFANLGEVNKEEVEITFIPKLYPGADQVTLSWEQIEEDVEDRYYKKWGLRMKKYKKLCKEDPPLTQKMKKQIGRLTCYYKQDTPRSYIKPIKVEVAWPSPRILVFHDLINDKEADFLIKLAHPRLNRATVHNKKTGKLENAEYRVSKTAWLDVDLPEDKEGIVRRVNRRMEDATELSHDYAELQQINNYGMGGQYEPHYDMRTLHDQKVQKQKPTERGGRIATILLYLHEPLAGGATIFTDSGARLRSKKNAAAFWYNLLPNGDPDLITRHAGCPVLAGTKWVMNKWFHVNDQIFTRPCDLEQFKREKETKLYNGKYTI